MPTQSLLSDQQTPEAILAAVRGFLKEYPGATVMEGGEAVFDLRTAEFELREDGGRIVLHVWSEERNLVRRVLQARRKGLALRLEVQRLGQREPASMELVAERGQRLLLGRERDRQRFADALQGLLRREFAMWRVEGMRSTAELQHSFGPGYARCVQVAGRSAWAVVAVRAGEAAATVDGVLAVALLWLQRCREQAGGRRLVEGVRVIVPQGQAGATQGRMAWLDRRLAKYELYTLEESEGVLRRVDPADRGNVEVELMRAPQESEDRLQEAVPRVLALLPDGAGRSGLEMRRGSGPELQFLRHGLPFARVRMAYAGQGFRRALQVTVGGGAQETVLTEQNAPMLREMVGELFRRRQAQEQEAERTAAQRDALFRTEPERWLESRLQREIHMVDGEMEPEPVYAQVRGMTGAGEEGVADLLGVTREGRLAVMEVKVKEDLHLPMQGLDYWLRLRALHGRGPDAQTGLGELQRHGYFPKTRLMDEAPLLYLLAPALRIHPAVETILRHFDPRVPWRLVALDERWRERIRPVWRRSSGDRGGLPA